MSNILSKISKAVDAFTDVLTEDIDSNKKQEVYKYDDFKKLCVSKHKHEPRVKRCTIAVTQEKEFDGETFPEEKYLVRIVFLDEANRPILVGNNTEEFMGDVIITSSIDTPLKEFMGDKEEKTIVIKGGK